MFSSGFPFGGGLEGGCFLLTMVFFFLFFLFSSTKNIPCHPERAKGARDLALQRSSFSFCFSLLFLASTFSFVFLELCFLFNYPLPRSLSKEGGELALRFLGLKN